MSKPGMILALAWAGAATCAVAAQLSSEPPPAAATRSVYAITYRPGPNWKPGRPMRDQGLRDHFLYVKALADRGRIAVAGAIEPDGGLMLIDARDQREAERIVAEDPAVRAGIFVGTVAPFTPRFVGARPLVPVRP